MIRSAFDELHQRCFGTRLFRKDVDQLVKENAGRLDEDLTKSSDYAWVVYILVCLRLNAMQLTEDGGELDWVQLLLAQLSERMQEKRLQLHASITSLQASCKKGKIFRSKIMELVKKRIVARKTGLLKLPTEALDDDQAVAKQLAAKAAQIKALEHQIVALEDQNARLAANERNWSMAMPQNRLKVVERPEPAERVHSDLKGWRSYLKKALILLSVGAASLGVSAVLLNPSLLIITPSITVSPLLCLNALIVFSVLYGLSAGQGRTGLSLQGAKAKAIFAVVLITAIVLSPLGAGASFWMPWVTLHCSLPLFALTVGLSCIGGLAMGLGYACSRISQKPAPRGQLADVIPPASAARLSQGLLIEGAGPSAAVSRSCSTKGDLPQQGLQTEESRRGFVSP